MNGREMTARNPGSDEGILKLSDEAEIARLRDELSRTRGERDSTWNLYCNEKNLVEAATLRLNNLLKNIDDSNIWVERRFVEDELVSEELRYSPMSDAERTQLEVMYTVEVLKVCLIPEIPTH